MGYDAMALGERDLQLGPEALRQRIDEADFPVLSANLELAGDGGLFVEPYAILEVGGGRAAGVIALTGLVAASPLEFVVTDPFAALRQVLPEVASQADIVVLLGHLGWSRNVQLADQFPEVDVIVGGGAQEPPPEHYTSPDGTTHLAQAEHPSLGHAGRLVGVWEVSLPVDGGPEIKRWRAVSLDPSLVDDLAMNDLLRRFGRP